jgi:hypothetical protein
MREKDETYNGWTNYETWNVKLWIDNDEKKSKAWRDAAIRHGDKPWFLAKILQAEITMKSPNLGPSMYSDILNAGLSVVNWREIAESLIEGLE